MRPAPWRSAKAPAKGWNTPHSRFCSAIEKGEQLARPAVVERHRLQEQTRRCARTPMASVRISAPQAMTTAGGAGRRKEEDEKEQNGNFRCEGGDSPPPWHAQHVARGREYKMRAFAMESPQ